MTGSPKQIEWADKIRATIVADVTAQMQIGVNEFSPRLAAYVALAERLLSDEQSAAWWIENRNADIKRVLHARYGRPA